VEKKIKLTNTKATFSVEAWIQRGRSSDPGFGYFFGGFFGRAMKHDDHRNLFGAG